jgi:hypothetical protein
MNKIWDKETTQLYILFIICFISVYFLPAVPTRVLFAGFILYIFRTKKDYFWFVLFFILDDAPGKLFSLGGREQIMRLPIYSFGIGFSFGFQELFTIAYLLKAVFLKRRLDFVFSKEFKWFYFVGIALVFYSFMLGIDIKVSLTTFRALLPWSWIMIFPLFIRDKETMIKASRLLFPIVFLALASQIYTYFYGTYLDSTFSQSIVLTEDVAEEGTAVRSYSSGFILLFCIFQSTFYLLANNTSFKRSYLIILIFIASLSTLLTSTRGWIIALAVFFLGIILFIPNRLFSRMIIQFAVISFVLLMTLQFVFPVISTQIDNSILRLSTMEDLAKGDLTAGGTLARITDRSPVVMNEFWKSPVLGWGFTYIYYIYTDGHVGNQSILLNSGIIGFVILIILYIVIFFKIWKWSTNPSVVAQYGVSLRVFAIGMIAVFIIHSSSTQFWGYYLDFSQTSKILFYAFFFTSVSTLVVKYRSPIKSKKKTPPKFNESPRNKPLGFYT